MEPDLPQLGQRIKELRESAGITQAVLARRVGISAAYLSLIEGAKAKRDQPPSRPAVTILRGIAAAIPGALASELLELAGWEDDAAYDRVREAQAARAAKPPASTIGELASRLDAVEAELAGQRSTLAQILDAVTASDRRVRGPGK